jgi:hypothetical protein
MSPRTVGDADVSLGATALLGPETSERVIIAATTAARTTTTVTRGRERVLKTGGAALRVLL